MNKSRTTDNRVKWTTLALNWLLGLFEDVENLQIKKKDATNNFAKGTLQDAKKIYNIIAKRIGVEFKDVKVVRGWRANYWYEKDVEIANVVPPSNIVEKSFAEVADIYIKHQKTWDNAEEVEEAEEASNEEEEEEERLNARNW